MDSRQEWLNGLQVGDEVAIDSDRIEVITRRTPSGRIVAGPFEFNADGTERGGSKSYWNRTSIGPATDAVRAVILRRDLIWWFERTKGATLTIEQARAIKAIIIESEASK